MNKKRQPKKMLNQKVNLEDLKILSKDADLLFGKEDEGIENERHVRPTNKVRTPSPKN